MMLIIHVRGMYRMNDKIREVYVRFHTDRRLKLEALTEQRRIQLIEEDGRENSPHTVRDALYWAMEQTTEEDELNVFADMIIQECIMVSRTYTYCDIAEDRLDHYSSGYLKCAEDITEDLKCHFGIE